MEIKRCYDTLIGASVGENQLVQSGATSVTVQSGHKYYAKINGTESLGASTGSAITINDSAKDMVVDLTQMLGSAIADYTYSLESATAGAGIAKLREWGFLKGYQAYNAGSIESVEVTGKKCVGFNQWDEEWEVGLIAVATGQNINGTGIRSKNMCKCLSNTIYYVTIPYTYSRYIFWYDSNGDFISQIPAPGSGAVTTPSNACYFRLRIDTVLTYNHDICINLSSDRNGEYEAYAEQSYDYGDDKLRGIFKLDSNNELYADGDTKASDGTVTRKYGVVDLGALDWKYEESNKQFYSNIFANGYSGWMYHVICSRYVQDDRNSEALSTPHVRGINNNRVYIVDDTYNDAATLKTAMSGVMLVYELATPTTEQSTPFPSPQVCYPDGTEEYATSNGVPVGHETRYEL